MKWLQFDLCRNESFNYFSDIKVACFFIFDIRSSKIAYQTKSVVTFAFFGFLCLQALFLLLACPASPFVTPLLKGLVIYLKSVSLNNILVNHAGGIIRSLSPCKKLKYFWPMNFDQIYEFYWYLWMRSLKLIVRDEQTPF